MLNLYRNNIIVIKQSIKINILSLLYMFKIKYLKYKEKYLLFKSQKGGDNTFIIYTTGIGNWGDLNIFTLWQETLCKQICDIIPSTFTNIIIIHCDLMSDNNIWKEDKKDKTITIINSVIANDNNIDCRIETSRFQTEALDFNIISQDETPYIIIDFAHIFSYIKDELASQNNTRAFINIREYRRGTIIGPVINLNVVYLGYEAPYLNHTSFFKVNYDNTITTFVNRLFDEDRFILDKYDILNPNLKIEKIFKSTERELLNQIRKKFGNINIYEEHANKTLIILEIKKNIIDLIMNTELNEENIINLVIEKIMIDYF